MLGDHCVKKRVPRVPNPPPKPSPSATATATATTTTSNSSRVRALPPPPPIRPSGGPPCPPPLPARSLPKATGSGGKVFRLPELVEFYQSLMRREAKRDTAVSITSNTSDAAEARSNMIGEIENKSSFLLAVKADVETQGEFVKSLATEVQVASFTKIEDLISFVNWLDEELSFILLYRVEESVYALLRTRDLAISRYKEFGIPVDWLLDSGVVGKIKLSSVQLARKYMKRVALELDASTAPKKERNREFLILQGVRFAFRVHQFAGGFDAESMHAFEELKSRIHINRTGVADRSKT